MPAPLLSVHIDRAVRRPAYLQVYDRIRTLILSGRLAPGERLPPTRGLADETGLSRTTVVAAYDQLHGEGYIERRQGSGAYVCHLVPDHLTAVRPAVPARQQVAAGPGVQQASRPFGHAAPDLAGFPMAQWARLLQRSWQDLPRHYLERVEPFGFPPLRAAIARHLAEWRGIDCDAARVVVTASSSESLRLVLRVLDVGSTVAMEDPGYRDMRQVIESAGRAVRPVPVDEEGLCVDRIGPEAGLAVVTPSRQFPLGMTLSLSRRLALLNWAATGGRWVIEDDFDSEFRYTGSPVEALASLDRGGRVIYFGSFSKVLFRTLRISFLVLPSAVADRFAQVLAHSATSASMLPQPPLAAFIDSGGFATHLRRMRRLYGQRHRALIQAIATEAGDLLEVQRIDSGMHAIAWFRPALAARMTDREAERRAATAGLTARALSPFYRALPCAPGLVLGFAGTDTAEMGPAAERLAKALRDP